MGAIRVGRRGAWTAELGEAFLALVRETGHAGEAARALGHPQLFWKRLRRDPDFRRRYREAAEAAGRPRPVVRVRWSAALGERFLVLLAETGNARQSAIRLGAVHIFNNRMRRDPEFRRRATAAAAEADERLRGAESPFPAPIEYKSMPPHGGDGTPPRPGRRKPPPSPWSQPPKKLPTDAEMLGGFLRPGRKRKPSRPQPVIRRNCRGRTQVSFAREGHWTQEIEDDFLKRLAATGNFDACAKAVGFQPASVHERERTWPAFARACEQALEEADVTLRYKLVAYANALMRSPGEAEAAGIEEEEVPFDPVTATKILSHLDARRYGRSGKGWRKGPPERTFQQACESILAKIEAIERHEEMMKERNERKADSPPCTQGGAGGGCVSGNSLPAETHPPPTPPCIQGGEE
ncbi:MAG TPA: hypothetical protein VF718_03540 [Allosphingosinicella sp.]|jgi:hypothetical protein